MNSDKPYYFVLRPRKAYQKTWVQSIPKKYFRYFLQLWIEGVKFFYPPPTDSQRFAFWRMVDENLELAFEKKDKKYFLTYAKSIQQKDLEQIVTKKDWDQRISKVLSEKH